MMTLDGEVIEAPKILPVKWWQIWRWHLIGKAEREWKDYHYRCQCELECQLRGIKPKEW